MTHEEFATRLTDSTVRIHSLYWLAACNDGETLPEQIVEEFAEDDCWCEAFSEDLPGGIESEAELADLLFDRRLFGFLAKVETPFPISASSHTSFTFSWGMFTSTWVYSETLEELAQKATEWAEGWRAKKIDELIGEKGGGGDA